MGKSPDSQPDEQSGPTVLRDFIYLDTDRLYSLYSQMFQGVRGRVVNRLRKTDGSEEEQRGRIGQGSTSRESHEDEWSRMEDILLHDYLYEELEGKLRAGMLDSGSLTEENYREALSTTSFVRVTGKAEIQDYERMSQIMQNYDKLGRSVAYSQATDQGFIETCANYSSIVAHLKSQLKTASPAEKAILNEQIQSMELFKSEEKLLNELIKEMNLNQGSGMMPHLDFILHLFYHEGFDITLQQERNENLFFRGILNRQWLRVSPDSLKSLYSGTVDFNWVMVGHVTKLPPEEEVNLKQFAKTESAPSQPNDAPTEAPAMKEAPSMKDALRVMSAAANGLERMFFDSKDRKEIAIRPLAIYQEIPLGVAVKVE